MSSNHILDNLIYLTEHITNLPKILLILLQDRVITVNEREIINAKETPFMKNEELLMIILKKDLKRESFLDLLRKSNNNHCADIIEGVGCSGSSVILNTDQNLYSLSENTRSLSLSPSLEYLREKDFIDGEAATNVQLSKTTINKRSKDVNEAVQYIPTPLLKGKWWPEPKLLIKNLHKRKIGDKLVIEVIHDTIHKDDKHMTVICESVAASKYSGMGGIGKTLTAIWYAHHYKEEYEQIIWVDCSEGNHVQSFEKLARDLEVKNRNELSKDEFPRKCFEILQNVETLLVCDNAENYRGKDGIIQFLPKEKKNIFCLITSRSGEWGTENVGYGHISDFQLDIFSHEESLEFFKTNLDKTKIKYTDYELNELCKLLSYLPLAFQLAVAALINGKVNLQDYISKTSVYDSQKIVLEKFDDYEKTINGTVKISLDAMSEETNGDLAITVLLFLGYLKADDIHSKFLQRINNVSLVELQAALDLLEKYNLIVKTGKDWVRPDDKEIDNKIGDQYKWDIEMDLVSVHRLLQQVIRHNGKNSEKDTLRKILGCKGFIDYKLLPFTKYADEDLQKEFPKVKAELLDQEQLHKLVCEGRFEDAVQLARFIHEELKTNTSYFNYAVCLGKKGELAAAVVSLEKLLEEKLIDIGKWKIDDNPFVRGILKLEWELPMDLVVGHLLPIHWKLGNKQRAQEILNASQKFSTGDSYVWWFTFIQILNSELINSNYSLECNQSISNIIKLILGGKCKKIALYDCSIDSSIRFPSDLEELTLWHVQCNEEEEGESFDELIVKLLFDFRQMRKLRLKFNKKTRISIFLGRGEDNISLEYVYLEKVIVLNWKEANWTVEEMGLREIDFLERMEMKVKELEIGESIVDVSCLPQNIEKLSLCGMKDVRCSVSPELPNLKYLKLSNTSSSCLSHFTCTKLTHIHFDFINEVNLDLLPETVQKIRIKKHLFWDPSIVGRVRKIKKLILEESPFRKVEEILSHFQTEELVVDYSLGFNTNQLMDLTNKRIKRVSVGRIPWFMEDFRTSIFSKHVDRIANYYFFEGGKGRAIEEKEFKTFLEL